MIRIRPFALLLALLALPLHSSAQTFQFQTPIAGDTVPVTVDLVQVPTGVQVTVSIEPGSGDLLGFFANVNDERLLPALDVLDPSGVVRASQFKANAVSKVGGGNNVLPASGWDLGVQLGRPGTAGGELVSTTFTLRARDLPPGSLTPAMLTSVQSHGFVMGVRIQATAGPQGSSKMGLNASLPSVRILLPAEGALLNRNIVDVSGQVSSGATVRVSADNSVSATYQGDLFAALGVLLHEGPNTIVATATSGGGTVRDEVSVIVDTTAPVITIFEPANGLETFQQSPLLFGVAEDANGIVAVFVQGVLIPVDPSGFFETSVELMLGSNAIEVQAVDAAGNIGAAQLVVIRVEDGGPQPQ
jgi:hypothetical protein